MGIRFDYKRAKNDLDKALDEALKRMGHEIRVEIEHRIPDGNIRGPVGYASITGAYLMAQIVGDAIALMANYGRGSLMARDNPGLSDYMRSPYWNPDRNPMDMYIRTRKGPYIDIFGQRRRGSPKGGRILEPQMQESAYLKAKFQAFEPWRPTYAFDRAMRWLANGRFKWIIQNAIREFPWHKYLVITKD